MFGVGRVGCHCLLLETDAGLLLVDTGFGMADVERPQPRLSRLVKMLHRPDFDPLDTAVEQVRELGFAPEAVKHIVLTHLDFDHAGGLADFPAATIHVLADEADAARHRRGFIARRRYRPAQWRASAASWREHKAGGEQWFGFDAVRPLAISDKSTLDLLMVRLPGHTAGHCGVAVRDDAGRWLLHAGDAYFHHAEMNAGDRGCPVGARGYQWLVQVNGRQRRHTRQRLRELLARSRDEVTVFCSHDLTELQNRQRAAETRLRKPPRALSRAPGPPTSYDNPA